MKRQSQCGRFGEQKKIKLDPAEYRIVNVKLKVKVKQSRYRPGVAQRVPGS